MNANVSCSVCKIVRLATTVIALSSAAGCLPKHQASSPPRSGVAIVDRATCIDRQIRSIWKGADVAGSACVASLAGGRAPHEERRIRKVCERTQIRTILTGDAPSSFTLRTCAARTTHYEQPAIGRVCRSVARAQDHDLNSVQLAACRDHLRDELEFHTLATFE